METVEQQLEKYKADGAHILIPSVKMSELSPIHELVLDVEYISIDPEDGEVYVEKKAYKKTPAKYAIRAQGYQKLAICASIESDAENTRIT